MVVTLRAFPSGTPIPNTLAGTVQLQPGTPVLLSAPLQVYGPGTPQPAYGFVFWNTTTDIRTTPTLSFTAPNDTSTIHVTAWYFPQGGSCRSCPPGTGVSTYAFSLNDDAVISDTPIASVTPAGTWSGAPSRTVSTTTSPNPVVITARPLITGSGLFHNWLQFGSGSVSGSTLTVPSRGASLAIAFFGIPVPDPCDDVRAELEYLSPGDFQNQQQYLHARQTLLQQVHACEKQYGEAPSV
jgi:hypothetical protein